MITKRKPTISICITSLGASKRELEALPGVLDSLKQSFTVNMYEDIQSRDMFGSQPVKDRITSLNWAADNGDVILSWNGGYNSIELLADFEKIKIGNDKVFVGYSDNTILANALPAMKVCRAWQGPMLANWVRTPQFGGLWAECLRVLYDNNFPKLSALYNQLGMTVFRAGNMRGKVWGGNNYTFDLLQGTRFCPSFTEPFILLLEGEDFVVDKKRVWQDFIRNLDSIMLLPGARDSIRGLLIGRFPSSYKLDLREVETSFQKRPYLDSIPIVYNFPGGYATPALYLPIGEELSIKLKKNNRMELDTV